MRVGGSGGDAKDLGHFAKRQPSEITQLDELGDGRLDNREGGKSIVEGQELVGHFGLGDSLGVERFAGAAAAALATLLTAGRVDEDMPHGLGGRRQKLGTATPAGWVAR